MRLLIAILLLCCTSLQVDASRYIVYFKDKGDLSIEDATPIAISTEAQKRRLKHNIQYDYNDLPVYAKYINKLTTADVKVLSSSRWLNAVLVETEKPVQEIVEISENIVKVELIAAKKPKTNKFEYQGSTTTPKSVLKGTANINYGVADTQNRMYDISYLHDKGFLGDGINVAFIDAGFEGADTSAYFTKPNKRLIATKDFWGDTSVYKNSIHGTHVASIVVVDSPGVFVGMAPRVNMMYALTDDLITETRQDEYNYIRALEWADSNGVDIISVSLSYKLFDSAKDDYVYSDMDGKTAITTIGVSVATSKGILLVNSAGNSGYLCAPCDADSILCVGGADRTKQYDYISSRGPSYDGRIKPDIAALTDGVYYIGPSPMPLYYIYGGTSSATPFVTGIAACLMQANPTAKTHELIEAIIKSSTQYNNPDSLIGHGVPNARKADSILKQMLSVKRWETEENKVVSLFPNPAKDIVYIAGHKPVKSVAVVSMSGSLLTRVASDIGTQAMSIDISKYPVGTYVVIVSGSDFKEELKLVKAK